MHVQLTVEGESEQVQQEVVHSLDELARWGAQQMIALALQAEVADYLERHQHEKDEGGTLSRCGTGVPAPGR